MQSFASACLEAADIALGLQMSYNNYLDGDAAYTAVCDFPEPSCVIVKHTNPCGAASRADLKEAYPLAVRADPTSAFGGIVAFNRCTPTSTHCLLSWGVVWLVVTRYLDFRLLSNCMALVSAMPRMPVCQLRVAQS